MENRRTSDIVLKKIASEPQLAKELNVSRVSVREAIEKMATLNILTKKQGKDTFVNDFTPDIYLNSLIPMITLDKDNYLDPQSQSIQYYHL